MCSIPYYTKADIKTPGTVPTNILALHVDNVMDDIAIKMYNIHSSIEDIIMNNLHFLFLFFLHMVV